MRAVLHFWWRCAREASVELGTGVVHDAHAAIGLLSLLGRHDWIGRVGSGKAFNRPAGILLSYATIGYNSLEAIGSLLAGLLSGSVALVGFGIDRQWGSAVAASHRCGYFEALWIRAVDSSNRRVVLRCTRSQCHRG